MSIHIETYVLEQLVGVLLEGTVLYLSELKEFGRGK